MDRFSAGGLCSPQAQLTAGPGSVTVRLNRNHSLFLDHAAHAEYRVYFGPEGEELQVRRFTSLRSNRFCSGSGSVSSGWTGFSLSPGLESVGSKQEERKRSSFLLMKTWNQQFELSEPSVTRGPHRNRTRTSEFFVNKELSGFCSSVCVTTKTNRCGSEVRF